jgi:spore coat polysaccharide biosynthesis protein SpsF (cytidylyltransferase family)
MIPEFLISKATMIAVKNKYDYLSNVDERCRLAVDGHDVEVVSGHMMHWLAESDLSKEEREHVTLKIRKGHENKILPDWALIGSMQSPLPLQNIKLSVDTQDDLDKVRRIYNLRESQNEKARRIFGERNVHKY